MVKSLLSQYFWKEQLDTFDNQCDVLRAAFCDSRDVYTSHTKEIEREEGSKQSRPTNKIKNCKKKRRNNPE